MAQFCPVAPIRILSKFNDHKILGKTHLLLAHDIVSNPLASAEYQHVFGNRDWEGMIILDNSIIELGSAVKIDTIAEAAEIVKANVIVLPDVLEDGAATVKSIDDAYDEWSEVFDNVLGDDHQFMFVPQGKTLEEFTECAQALAAIDDGRDFVWGIPRNVVALHNSREGAIAACYEIAPDMAIHMLGFSDNLLDDISCARSQIVGSIDSAVPFRAKNFDDVVSANEVIGKRGDWWDSAHYHTSMDDNLLRARKIFSGHQDLVKD